MFLQVGSEVQGQCELFNTAVSGSCPVQGLSIWLTRQSHLTACVLAAAGNNDQKHSTGTPINDLHKEGSKSAREATGGGTGQSRSGRRDRISSHSSRRLEHMAVQQACQLPYSDPVWTIRCTVRKRSVRQVDMSAEPDKSLVVSCCNLVCTAFLHHNAGHCLTWCLSAHCNHRASMARCSLSF